MSEDIEISFVGFGLSILFFGTLAFWMGLNAGKSDAMAEAYGKEIAGYAITKHEFAGAGR